MNEFDQAPDNNIDFLLSQRNDAPSAAHLREATLTRTLGVIRFRRRMKRIGVAAGFAGCYLAGILTMSVWPLESANPASVQPRKVIRPLTEKKDAKTQIATAPLSSYDRLRRTADRQLEVDGDIAAAARSYRRALAVASAGEREMSLAEDSWLLMALKTDHSPEKVP
jgi:hypothetical protein